MDAVIAVKVSRTGVVLSWLFGQMAVYVLITDWVLDTVNTIKEETSFICSASPTHRHTHKKRRLTYTHQTPKKTVCHCHKQTRANRHRNAQLCTQRGTKRGLQRLSMYAQAYQNCTMQMNSHTWHEFWRATRTHRPLFSSKTHCFKVKFLNGIKSSMFTPPIHLLLTLDTVEPMIHFICILWKDNLATPSDLLEASAFYLTQKSCQLSNQNMTHSMPASKGCCTSNTETSEQNVPNTAYYVYWVDTLRHPKTPWLTMSQEKYSHLNLMLRWLTHLYGHQQMNK